MAMTFAFALQRLRCWNPSEYLAVLCPLLTDMPNFRAPASSAFLVALPLALAGAGPAAMEGRRRLRS